MRSSYALIAVLLGALAVTSAGAAEERDGDKGGDAEKSVAAAEPHSEDRGAKKDTRTGASGSDLVTCKRDADGMRGPERSRFMTQCLRERK